MVRVLKKEGLALRIYSFLFLLLLFLVPAAHAQERYTQLRLVPERSQVQAGETITVGIEQIIAPGWHTYWKNPGDSGAPPVFKWDLPDGFDIGAVQWPAPEKIPYGPLLNYGYSHSAMMLQDLSIPADYDGGALEIPVDIEILVCADVCIPEFDVLTLRLNDGSAADNSTYIAAAREQIAPLVDWVASYAAHDGDFVLSVELPQGIDVQDAYFIPEAWGAVNNAADVVYDIDGQTLTMTQKRGDQDLTDFDSLPFILTLETDLGVQHYEMVAEPAVVVSSSPPVAVADAAGVVAPSLIIVLFGAFIGGLILNLMPCVFPVLSLKALSLVKIADDHPEEARAHGLMYTAGVVLSFLAVAGILMVLQHAGAQIGWGFQLQNPLIVTLLAYLLLLVGLNLAGLFEFGGGLTNVGGGLTQKRGKAGAFFTGILATIVATPCTAPFMATAIGVALTQPPVIGLSVFAVLGLGLAFPYLALSFIPALQHVLPKPGAWMRTFQQFLAFPMFMAVAWLLWVLAQQVGDVQLFAVMLGMVAIGFGVWVWPKGGVAVKLLALVSFGLALWALPAMTQKTVDGTSVMEDRLLSFGEAFSGDALNAYITQTNQPVFVEMTAAWCITCKLNHASSINVQATRDLFADLDVAFLVGDWTNRDAEITAYLQQFDRNGVPLYVFYGAPNSEGARPDPVVLPQLLTPGIVESYVRGTN